MQLTFGSVCSGIGAPEVAWQPLGWRCAFVSEIDPFPRAVLTHRLGAGTGNGPEMFGDFTQIGADDAEPIDLLVGGTPCQSFSVAGKRLGLDDPRGNPAIEYLALARRLRPKWLVWENVPGVLSSNGGRDFGAFLWIMGKCGYGFAYRVLDAQYFGVPQRRRRVFVVGYLGDWRRAAAVLFEPESMRGDCPPRRETGQAPAAGIAARAGNGSRSVNGNGNLIAAFGGNNTRGPIDVATARNAHGGPHGRLDFESETFVVYRTSPTLRAMRPAIRRLTPLEAERLQGFPDDWTLISYRGKPAADGPRYKGTGNSMAVPVMRWIGERIDAAEAAFSCESANGRWRRSVMQKTA